MNTGNNILYVEDNDDDAELFELALERSGLQLRLLRARDGAHAIELLDQTRSGDLPRLVLLDIKMPRMDGFGFLAHIRKNERIEHLPVVMFTSSDSRDDVVRSYTLRANSYICKPMSMRDLEAVCVEIVQYWLFRNIPCPS